MLAEGPGDGLGSRAYSEFGFHACEPLADVVQAEEQLPSDVRLVVYRHGGAQDLGLAGAEPEPPQRLEPEPRDLFLEQQGVWIAGQQVDGQAPAVAHANKRRARR